MNGRFEIFRDRKKQFRWRFRAANGEIVCQSEAYTTKAKAIHGIGTMACDLQNWTEDDVIDLTLKRRTP